MKLRLIISFLLFSFFTSHVHSEEGVKIITHVYPGSANSKFQPFLLFPHQSIVTNLLNFKEKGELFPFLKIDQLNIKLGRHRKLEIKQENIEFIKNASEIFTLQDHSVRPLDILISEVYDKKGNLVFKLDGIENYTKNIFNPNFDKEDAQNSPLGPGWIARSFYSSETLKSILENSQKLKVEKIKHDNSYASKITGDSRADVYGIVSNIFEVKPNTIYQISWKSRAEIASDFYIPAKESLTLSFMGEKGADDIENFIHKQWNYSIHTENRDGWIVHKEIFKTPPTAKWAFLKTKAYLNKQNGSFFWANFDLKKLDNYPNYYSFENQNDFFPNYKSYKEYDISSKKLTWNLKTKELTLSKTDDLFLNVLEKEADWDIIGKERNLVFFEPSQENKLIIKLGSKGEVNKKKILLRSKKSINIHDKFPHTLKFSYQANKIHFNQNDFFRLRLLNGNSEVLFEEIIYYKFLKTSNDRLAKKEDGWISYEHTIPLQYQPNINEPPKEVYLEIEKQPNTTSLELKDFSLIQDSPLQNTVESNVYESEGYFVSKILPINSNTISYALWEGNEPLNTAIKIFYRTGVTPEFTPTTWTDWKQLLNNKDLPPIIKGIDQFIQLKVVLNTKDNSIAPTLKYLHIHEKRNGRKKSSQEIKLLSLKNGNFSEETRKYVKLVENKYSQNDYSEKLKNLSLKITKNYNDEIDKILQLMDFLLSHTGNGFAVIEKNIDSFSLLMNIAKGHGGVCGNIAWIFKNLCMSSGILARQVYLSGLSGSGHRAVEVWLDTYQKWAFIDPTYRGFFLHKGIPLSTIELHKYYLENKLNDIEIYTSSKWVAPMHSMEEIYGDFSQKISLKKYSALFEIIALDIFGYFQEKNYPFLKDIKNRKFFNEEDAYFPINQVEMSFEVLSKNTIMVYLKNNTFHFDHYEAYINGNKHIFKKDKKKIKLKAGNNSFAVSAVSREGKKGKQFSAEFFFKQPFSTSKINK